LEEGITFVLRMGDGISTIRLNFIISVVVKPNIERVVFLIMMSIIFQKLVEPVKIERWAIVNFSSRCNRNHLLNLIKKNSELKGMVSFPKKNDVVNTLI
jgi:hypothetical protein